MTRESQGKTREAYTVEVLMEVAGAREAVSPSGFRAGTGVLREAAEERKGADRMASRCGT